MILIVFLRFIFPLIKNRNLISYKFLVELRNSGSKSILLDVRSRQEYKLGHIPGAKNIAHDKLPQAMVKGKKDTPVVVYCRSGLRAGRAKKALERAGYSQVYSFGGISRWKSGLE